MIDPVAGRFEIIQYNNKKEMGVENLVETAWIISYPWPIEITFDQGL